MLATAVTVGVGLTINVNCEVLEQVVKFCPVKVYTVVIVGVTVKVEPIIAPGFQV